MNKPLEIEIKHDAKNISLKRFKAYCTSPGLVSYKVVSGYDRFYSNSKDPDSFCRHRYGESFNQFTLKRKQSPTDNYIRVEHNIELAKEVTPNQVEKLASEFGFEFNTTIYKTCFIYEFDYYVAVFYIIYDEDLHEKGRYLEFEAKEDYPWSGEQEAWQAVVTLEKLASKVLGINPKDRLKKSLFEMYRKETQ